MHFCTKLEEENEAYISHTIHFSINVLPFEIIKIGSDQLRIAMLCIYFFICMCIITVQ
jgi:hypothetical protein